MAGVRGWREFMSRYMPDGDVRDQNFVNGYNSAMVLEAVLKACGNDLSTENILKQAYAIRDMDLPIDAGHQGQHQPDRSCPDRADAVHAFYRQAVGAVRGAARRGIDARCVSNVIASEAKQFLSRCGIEIDCFVGGDGPEEGEVSSRLG